MKKAVVSIAIVLAVAVIALFVFILPQNANQPSDVSVPSDEPAVTGNEAAEPDAETAGPDDADRQSRIEAMIEAMAAENGRAYDHSYSAGYTYSVLLNGTLEINECSDVYTDELIIPEFIDNRRVSIIGFNAFNSCKAGSVVIPDGVTAIGYNSFIYAKLYSIRIPASVANIDPRAFVDCNNLTTVCCAKGSYAEEWAQRAGYNVVYTEENVSARNDRKETAIPAIGDLPVSSDEKALYGSWKVDLNAAAGQLNREDALLVQLASSLLDYQVQMTFSSGEITVKATDLIGEDHTESFPCTVERDRISDESGHPVLWRVSGNRSELYLFDDASALVLRLKRLTESDGSVFRYSEKAAENEIPADLWGEWKLRAAEIRDIDSGETLRSLDGGTMTVSADGIVFRDNSLKARGDISETVTRDNDLLYSGTGRLIRWKLSEDGQTVTMIDNQNLVWAAERYGSEGHKLPSVPQRPIYRDPALKGTWTLIHQWNREQDYQMGQMLQAGTEDCATISFDGESMLTRWNLNQDASEYSYTYECGAPGDLKLYLEGQPYSEEPYRITENLLEYEDMLFARKGTEEERIGKARLRRMAEEGTFLYRTEDGGAVITAVLGNVPALRIPDEIDGLPVFEISAESLSEHTDIEKLVLPKTLRSFEGVNLPNLREIELEEGNENLILTDGILFTANGKTLILYPAKNERTSYDIPAGTETIGANAFRNAANLKNVTFPAGLKNIFSYAFEGCSGLTSVALPEQMNRLDGGAFDNCAGLTEVTIGYTTSYSLSPSAFDGCDALQHIQVAKNTDTYQRMLEAGLPVTGPEVTPLPYDVPQRYRLLGTWKNTEREKYAREIAGDLIIGEDSWTLDGKTYPALYGDQAPDVVASLRENNLVMLQNPAGRWTIYEWSIDENMRLNLIQTDHYRDENGKIRNFLYDEYDSRPKKQYFIRQDGEVIPSNVPTDTPEPTSTPEPTPTATPVPTPTQIPDTEDEMHISFFIPNDPFTPISQCPPEELCEYTFTFRKDLSMNLFEKYPGRETNYPGTWKVEDYNEQFCTLHMDIPGEIYFTKEVSISKTQNYIDGFRHYEISFSRINDEEKVRFLITWGLWALNPTPAPTEEPTPAPIADSGNLKKDLEAGNTVTFGRYEQDNDISNGAEPIEWIVLDVQDGKALLLSKYGLDAKPYNTSPASVTWETCTLRNWMNEDFLNTAFSAEEQSWILTTDVDNSESQGSRKISGGNNTQDKVFLLSYAEAHKYLKLKGLNDPIMESRVAPTAWASAQGAIAYDNWETEEGRAAGSWWLRSPGVDLTVAAVVSNVGSLAGNKVYIDGECVRPALWINLESD